MHYENECPWEGQIGSILLVELNHLIGHLRGLILISSIMLQKKYHPSA